MRDSPYFKQAESMLRLMPFVAKEDCFALKGGTAINLFVRDMQRLSVDIDLTYLPLEERQTSLGNIEKALKRIAGAIEKMMPASKVQRNTMQEDGKTYVYKLIVATAGGVVKVEPNLVFRGSAYESTRRALAAQAQELFELSVTINTLSLADLYGSKLCAALDRQHPRDLFDVMVLMENEGITKDIRKAFLVYLAGHNRPPHKLLNPNPKDVRAEYESDFKGMSERDVSYEELIQCRDSLPNLILDGLTEDEKGFLVSIMEGQPEWAAIGVEGVERLPALQWKLFNVKKMLEDKRVEQVQQLREVLSCQ